MWRLEELQFWALQFSAPEERTEKSKTKLMKYSVLMKQTNVPHVVNITFAVMQI